MRGDVPLSLGEAVNAAKGYLKMTSGGTQLKSLAKFMLKSIGVILLLHVLFQVIVLFWGGHDGGFTFVNNITHRFDADNEMSLPTWFAVTQGMLVVAFFYLISLKQPDKPTRYTWQLLSLAVLLISIDEIATFHETLLQTVHVLRYGAANQSTSQNAIILISPLLIAGAIAFLYLLWRRLPRKVFLDVIKAFTVYACGAVVFEFISTGFNPFGAAQKFGLSILEEGLEFIGVWMLLNTAINHIERSEPEIKNALNRLLSS